MNRDDSAKAWKAAETKMLALQESLMVELNKRLGDKHGTSASAKRRGPVSHSFAVTLLKTVIEVSYTIEATRGVYTRPTGNVHINAGGWDGNRKIFRDRKAGHDFVAIADHVIASAEAQIAEQERQTRLTGARRGAQATARDINHRNGVGEHDSIRVTINDANPPGFRVEGLDRLTAEQAEKLLVFVHTFNAVQETPGVKFSVGDR